MPCHQTMAERVLAKTEQTPGGCWLWTGGVRSSYGRIQINGRTMIAHRAAYEAFVGPIPDGLQVDHLCRNRLCVNPAHLEAVTPKVNNARSTSPSALNAAKTHCPQGHPYDQDNTALVAGRRQCRTCHRRRVSESYQRRKKKVA